MADEEKNLTAEEEQAEEPVADDAQAAGPVAADAPPDEAEASSEDATAAPPADEAPEDDAPAEEEAPEAEEAEAPAEDAAPVAAEEEEAPEELSPKQQRKLARSTFSGEAGPSRTAEERAAERDARRRHAKEARSRVRARARQKKGEPRQGTPPAEREPGRRKFRQGTVVSDKADKTITVEVELARRHPSYEKVVRRSRKLYAHDEANEAREGDVVRVIETRPLSRTKRWRLAEIVERAPTR